MIDQTPEAPDPTPPTRDHSQEWIDLDAAARIMGCSLRHARRELEKVPDSLVRFDRAGVGRPRKMIHFSAHPALMGARLTIERARVRASPDNAGGAHPEDLAIARLRMNAVTEYRARRYTMSESAAAAITTAEWAHPRTLAVAVGERIARHQRDSGACEVAVGGFSLSTLRAWDQAERAGGLLGLVPHRRGEAGRPQLEIPAALLALIHSAAVATPRADMQKAIDWARGNWPKELWPAVSDSTIKRRIRAEDPSRFMDALGKGGIARFRAGHTPDVARDYRHMRYNEEWQLDDFSEDFYAHCESDAMKFTRPFAYGIIRVATREWICAVTCEMPITQEQVRVMLGTAMAEARGGVPERIRFERGAVACDDYLEDLLTDLGVAVSRTSMDGGKVHPGAAADRATGHFQGKGVVESNIRNIHNENWAQPGQVGTDERNTAQARLDNVKAEALRRYTETGEFLVLPSFAQAQAAIHQALETLNARPHSGLPEIIDPQTGERRHMSPAECARHKRRDALALLPESALPLFYAKGMKVPVTRNGIHIANGWYGRFDDDVAALVGTKVLAYAESTHPEAIYVVELGRCVDRFIEPEYGADGDLIARKCHIAKLKKNQYEAMIARALENGRPLLAEMMRFTANPVPTREAALRECPALAKRAGAMAAARTVRTAQRAESAARFELDGGAAPAAAGARRGLLARSEELAAQAAVCVGHAQEARDETDPFAGL